MRKGLADIKSGDFSLQRLSTITALVPVGSVMRYAFHTVTAFRRSPLDNSWDKVIGGA